MVLCPPPQNKDGNQMPINGLTLASQSKKKTNAISKRKQVANKWSYTRLLGNGMPINGLSPNSYQITGNNCQ
jgi:hypothetical protein